MGASTAEPMSGPIETPRPSAAVAIRTREEEQRSALAKTPVTDLATMSDDAFENALQRAATGRKRVERIFESVLVEGAHFGNPVSSNGRPVFNKPILYQAGAEELRRTFRLSIHPTERMEKEVVPPTLDEKGNIADAGFVSVTVHVAAFALDGTQVGTASANCNSREKRFQRFDKKGMTYTDARETLNDCIAMANKRAEVRVTRGALGLTPWLANEEEMENAAVDDKPITPWSEEEKKRCYDAASKKGIRKTAFEALVLSTLKSTRIATGDDVVKLLKAIEASWSPEEGEEREPGQD